MPFVFVEVERERSSVIRSSFCDDMIVSYASSAERDSIRYLGMVPCLISLDSQQSIYLISILRFGPDSCKFVDEGFKYVR